MSRKELTDEEILNKIKNHSFKDIGEYHRWISTLEPEYRYYSRDITWKELDIDGKTEGYAYTYVSCLYTDGDGGVMFFCTNSEIFEEQGMTMELINCSWCDITYSDIIEIGEEMEFLKENYSRRLVA